MMKFSNFMDALNSSKLWTPSSVALLAKDGVEPSLSSKLPPPTPLPTQPSTVNQESVAPTFVLGSSSLAHLEGVIPPLAATVRRAITLTTQDFTVYEGLRSLARQKKNVASGNSQTLDSMHLKQSDGYGHAVDLVPWIQSHPVWDWDGCWKVAAAMVIASTELHYADKIRWGGAWDKRLSDFASNFDALKAATHDYSARHAGPDFLDGPHFEWRG